jgi:hypothetical protein
MSNKLGCVQGKSLGQCADPKYLAWIEEYTKGDRILAGGCQSACREMQAVFPELLLIRGSIHLDVWCTMAWEMDLEGLEPGLGHFWLETADGLIIDPTAKQFTDPKGCYRAGKITAYFPFDETKAELLPTGKCPNCGFYCYNGRDLCSEECERDYAAYLQRECVL